MEKTIAFIGAGNMGGAIVRAVCRGLDPAQVIVYTPHKNTTDVLAAETGCCVAETAGEAVRSAKYVMLCVKPQVLPGVLRDLLPDFQAVKEHQVLTSIAAVLTLEDLSALLAGGGGHLPIVRVMPNTPAAIGEGLIFLAKDELVSDEDCAELEHLLRPCGTLEWTTEQYLDMGTAVAGCGPAFAYLFMEALADGGVQIGLPRAKAQRYAAQMLAGAAQMVLQTGQHPGALKDAVCSPGGTTIAGVAELENRGFRAAATQAVAAAYRRSLELKK